MASSQQREGSGRSAAAPGAGPDVRPARGLEGGSGPAERPAGATRPAPVHGQAAIDRDDPVLGPVMHRRLVAFARRFVGDGGEAEDLAQETLLRAGRAIDRLRAADRVESWLFRICRHVAIDHVRSRRVRRPVWARLPEDAPEPEAGPAPSALSPGPVLPLPDLPAHHRLLVGLHYEKGLSQATICRLTGLSASALRVRLYRARRALIAATGRRGARDGVADRRRA